MSDPTEPTLEPNLELSSPGPDSDALWQAGRRRRYRRLGVTGTFGVASLALFAMVSMSLMAPSPQPPTIAGLPGDDTAEELAGDDALPVEDDGTDDGQTEQVDGPEDPDLAEDVEPPVSDREDVETPDGWPDEFAEPDDGALAEPCGFRGDGDMQGFIDVFSPVDTMAFDGQQINLVGCANVFEATVNYRVLDGDVILEQGFTNAACGSGCQGEFSEQIVLDETATGPITIEVFWSDAKDGRDRDLVQMTLYPSR